MSQYVRVYYSIVDDERFATIFDTPHLAAWLRLLLLADAMWPASGYIPATERKASIRALAEAGLIEVEGGRFRVHGLDMERNKRRDSAAIGGKARQQSLSERSANGVPPLSLAEQSKAKQSRAAQDARDPADDYWTLTGKYPSDKLISWIDDLTGQYGAEAVIKHLALRHGEDRSTTTLLGRVRDSLKREARQLDQRERDAERAKVAEQRRVNVPVIRSYHNAGQHQAAPDPRCPLCQEAA